MSRHARTGIFLALITATCPLAATPPQSDPLHEHIAFLRDRFVKAVRHCGVTPRFVPAVAVVSTPSVIAYDNDQRAIIVGRWETLPPPIQGFFEQWAAKDFPGEPPRRLFDDLFNDFLVGHELGHWVADQSVQPLALDHYDAEIAANRYAIAFSDVRDPKETARIVRRFSYLGTLPNPVPAGEDARTWFNAHYDNLSRTNPPAYNWYQGLFMREAWRTHRSGGFCTLVKGSTKGS